MKIRVKKKHTKAGKEWERVGKSGKEWERVGKGGLEENREMEFGMGWDRMRSLIQVLTH